MLEVILYGSGALACVAVGYWLHYKFGTRLSADLEKIKNLKP